MREKAGGTVVLVMLLVLALLVRRRLRRGRDRRRRQRPPRHHRRRRRRRRPQPERGGRARSRTGPRRPDRRTDPGDRGRRAGARSRPPTPACRSTTPPRSRRRAARSRGGPARLWDYYTGGDDLDPVVTVDEDAHDRRRRRAGRLDRHPPAGRRRQVRERRGQGRRAPRRASRSSAEDARAALQAAYLQEDETAELVARPRRSPTSTRPTCRRRSTSSPTPPSPAPVTLVFGDSPVRLTPRRVRARRWR